MTGNSAVPRLPPVQVLLAEEDAGPFERHRFWKANRPAQQERYDKVMIATVQLAREQGFEAVQMRTVAAESGVSLATVYTYFQSRDYLVYRAAIAFNSLVMAQVVNAHNKKLATAAPDRLFDYVVDLIQTMHTEPNMVEAWVRSTMTSDPLVVAEQRNIDWTFWSRDMHDLPEYDLEAIRNQIVLIQDVYYAGTVRWAFGQDDLDDVVARCVRLARHFSTLPQLI